ncbi:MAG TPA: class I SAM-dependent methyltransferase [Planctomycetota bacterium]|nr:class I SAM-dependent methyltransferase [Planctomycetota bacterium]
MENHQPPDAVNTEALARLRALFQEGQAAVLRRYSQWFYSYHADLYVHGVPFEVYVRKVAGIVRALGEPGCVLDLAAGFGVYSCLLRILGVRHVVSMDYHWEKSKDATTLVRELGLDGVHILKGDALAFPLKEGRFDGALTLACLSHIREPEAALRNLARALRPGGKVYVFEDNNSTYPGYEKHMSVQWEAAESGNYDSLPSEKRNTESYLAIRSDMIRTAFSDMSAEAVAHCARETRGLYGRAILEATEGYRRGDSIRNPRRHLVCHPVSGEFEEYPLNPGLVKAMLANAGFVPKLRSPHYGPFRGRFRLLKALGAAAFRVCPMLLRWASPTFAVVGNRIDAPTP